MAGADLPERGVTEAIGAGTWQRSETSAIGVEYDCASTSSGSSPVIAREPHVTVFDKSARTDGTFSREDFTYDHASDVYTCPGGKLLTTTGTLVNDGATMLYRASKHDCMGCALKARCCPKEPVRKVSRSIYEGARDMAREIARSWEGRTSRRLRKKIEMLFAHLKRILKLDRLRLRGPNGARDEFTLAATAQNLRKMAKLISMPIARPA